MRLADAIREFTDYKRSLGMVFRANSARLQAFLRHVGDVELNSISAQQVATYLQGKEGPVTAFWFAKFQALDSFFRYAVSRNHMRHRSLLPTSLPKKPPRLTPYLYSIQEMRRLLSVADSCYSPRRPVEPTLVRTLLLLLYGTGMRISEALRLTLSDVGTSMMAC